MATSDTKLMTAEELLKMPKDGYRYELVRGVLRKMAPVGHIGGYYELLMGTELFTFVSANKFGRAYSSNTGFLLERDPDYVLAPDAAFVRQERVDAVGEERGYFPGAPDLVVEVISPSDRYADVEAKRRGVAQCGRSHGRRGEPARPHGASPHARFRHNAHGIRHTRRR